MLDLLQRPKRQRALHRVVQPTGRERSFRSDDFILSKTDSKGRILYANDTFLAVSGFRESELLGAPHSIIRHPEMPRCIFQVLWETISSGREIFAYIVNLCKNGDHYWVLAHVTATMDGEGRIVGYHSSRRCPDRAAVTRIRPLYEELLAIERRHADRATGLKASRQRLDEIVASTGKSFNEFVLSL
ncbi:Aerotaxis receptor [bacterium HR40]|nr:Aerotaxis receptor [bacterium HR40]